jgi:hypothetical protein
VAAWLRFFGDQTISDAWFGEKVSRPLGIGLDLLAESGNINVKVVRLRAVFGAPHGLEQSPVG